MEQTKPISTFIAGVSIVCVLFCYSIITSLAGLYNTITLFLIPVIVILFFYIFFVSKFAKAYQNTLSFGDLFSYGFKMTFYVALFFIMFFLIFAFALPDVKTNMLLSVRKSYEGKNFSPQQVEAIMDMFEKYFYLVAAALIVLIVVVLGTFTSIIAAIVPKKNQYYPQQ